MSEVMTLEYKLDDEAIVEITESIDSYLREHKCQYRNRTVFMLESILLDVKGHYTDPIDVSVSVIKRFGRSKIRVRYDGEEFNPTGNGDASFQTQILLANMGLAPSWNYRNRINEISIEIPRNGLKNEARLLLAFLASVIVGLSGSVLPEAFKSFTSVYILGTLSSIFMNLLSVFAGILIFLSILSGVCGMDDITDLSKNGKSMLKRTLLPSVVGVFVLGIGLIPFFNFSFGERTGGSGIKEIYDVIMNIIPSNPVSPFQEGNMLQISLIAVLTGSMMIILGNRVGAVKELVLQGSTLSISIVELVCRMLPLYIFADLTRLFWENGISLITSTWKPILLNFGINGVLVISMLFIISLKYKVKMSVLFNKVKPSFMIGLTTASSMAAYGTVLEINENKLGIDKGYSSFATPLKNQLHGLTAILGYLIAIYFCADYSGINTDLTWFVCAWIFIFLIIPAIPPVSGGMLICVGIILKQLCIPSSCIGMAATLIMIFDFGMTAAKIVLVHMEEIEEADRLGLLDKDLLVKE